MLQMFLINILGPTIVGLCSGVGSGVSSGINGIIIRSSSARSGSWISASQSYI